MKVFIDMARRYGAKLVTSKGKHLKFRDSLGHQISAPKTSSDFRAIRNFQSELRNKGFVDSQGAVARTKRVAQPKPTATQPTPTPKQRYEAGEKGLKTGTQTTFKDFMQKVDTARAKAPVAPKPAAPVQSASTTTTAQRMAQGYDQNIAPVINRRGREVLSSIQRRDRLVNKFGSVKEGVASMAVKAGSNLVPKIMTGIGAVGTMLQASKADKERRRQLAKDHNLDITKPGDRAKLGRLLKKDTEAKKRADKGDTRTEKEYRKDKADNNRLIDTTRQQLGQSKAKPGTKERAEIDKKLKDFRDELRKPETEPSPTRAKVRVKVGQEVPKPDNTLPKRTGASPQRVRDRRSYEAQQRRNLKENKFRYAAQLMKKAGITNYDDLVRTVSDIKRGAAERVIKQLQTKPIPTQRGLELQGRMSRAYDKNKDKFPGLFEDNKHRDAKLNYQYKQLQDPQDPTKEKIKNALMLRLKKV